MGGRVAEELYAGDVSSGAQMDIQQATGLARNMICRWGMSDELGLVAYEEQNEANQYLGGMGMDRNYSEATAKNIDEAVKKLLQEAHDQAVTIIKTNESKILLMTDMLMEFETLDKEDMKAIMEDKWDAEEKRKKLKFDADQNVRKEPPPPPKMGRPIDPNPTPA